MKKIFYLLLVFGFVFTSCEPLDDINSEIDAQKEETGLVVVGDDVYTLTSDDYDTLGLTYGSFDSEDDAKAEIPALLSEMHPHWGKNSSVLVNYQLNIGYAPGVSDYTGSDEYSLELKDYPGSIENAVAFYEDENVAELVPSILGAKLTTATEGDVVLAKYNQYVGETVNGITEFYSANFAGEKSLLDYQAVSVSGDQTWVATEYGIEVTGYDNGDRFANEDWLISADIDLSSFPNSTLQVDQTFNYGDPSGFSVLISTDYTDNVATATWEVIDLVNVPDGTSWDDILSEEYSLSAYNGETINIAFKYTSTDTDSGTYQVNYVSLKASGVEGEIKEVSEFYTYKDNSWELSEGVYYLSNEDFDSMGLNNFGSSTPADGYLPTFLNIKYPYAQEEDELIVIYNYVSSSTGAQLRGDLYTKEAGVWGGFQSTIAISLQFGHDGTSWIPDNTIKYTLGSDDYSYMSTELTGNTDFDNVSLTSLANYNDYDYNWEDWQIIYSLDLLLDYLNPTAEDGQKYLITYLLYDNGANDVSRYLIKKDGEWVLNE